MRQEAVLLRLIETVDLVDEQQRPLPVLASDLRRLEHLAEFRHPAENRRNLDEGQVGFVSQQPGYGGLAHPGRPPEDKRGKRPRRQHRTQRPIARQHLFLPDDIRQSPRTKPVGKRALSLWRGGWGILWDDFVAAFCTLLVIALWRF